jgi:hypothetical protein
VPRALESIALKIDSPTGQVLAGRGFYQLEEDSVYVQVGEYHNGRRFFNYLESEHVRFDIDRTGRLILIEVSCPRRRWEIDEILVPPQIAEPADVRWLDFRSRIPEPRLITNPPRAALLLRFAPDHFWRWFLLAESVFIQVDANLSLAAVLISRIEDDLAGREIAAFRRLINRRWPSKARRLNPPSA